MQTKHVIAFISGILLFLTSGFSVFAQSPLDSIGNVFERIFGARMFRNFFSRLTSGEASAMFWTKFLIWVLLFAIIDYGLSLVFRESRKTAHILAGIISLISVIAIPRAILIAIFQAYSTVVSVILLLIPIVAVIFLHLIVKRALQEHPRVAHLCGALLTLFVYAITTFMFRSMSMVKDVSKGTGKNAFAAIGDSSWAPFIQGALLVWAVYDIAMFIFGGKHGVDKAGSWLKGKTSGLLSKSGVPSTLGAPPMEDLRERVRATGSGMEHREEEEVRESREERRVLNQMSGLEEESVSDIDKAEKNLGIVERALESIKSAPTLQQKREFLRQVQEAIQKIVPEDEHIKEHIVQLEEDLGLLVRLEREQYKELSEDYTDTERIDALFRSHPKFDSSQMQDLRKKIQQKLQEQVQELRREYVETEREKQFFTQIEDTLKSFHVNMAGIVTALNSGDIDGAISHTRAAKNDLTSLSQLYTRAVDRNGLVARQVEKFHSDTNIKKMIDELIQ